LRPQAQPGHAVVAHADLDRQVVLQGQAQAHGTGGQQREEQAGVGPARAHKAAEGLFRKVPHLTPGRGQARTAPLRRRGGCLAQRQHDEDGNQCNAGGNKDEAPLEPYHRHQEQHAAAANRRADRSTGKHHAIGQTAFVSLQGVDGQGVDGHVLHRAKAVVDQQHARQHAQLRRQVQSRAGQQGDDEHDLRAQDPATPSAQAFRGEDVNEGPEGPLEGPRQIEAADKRADLGRADILSPQLRCHRSGRKAQRDAFGDVEEEEDDQAADAGVEEVGQAHGWEFRSLSRVCVRVAEPRHSAPGTAAEAFCQRAALPATSQAVTSAETR
jgi:hypothetical protein